MSVRLDRIDALPSGLDVLRAEASAEGYRFVERLYQEWQTNILRFNRDSEALLAAYVEQELAAIGGITLDPALNNALRMRRFYVRRAYRGQGIGRKLVEALLAQRHNDEMVVVNAGGGSAPFWEALGFVADMRAGHTHLLPSSRNRSS